MPSCWNACVQYVRYLFFLRCKESVRKKHLCRGIVASPDPSYQRGERQLGDGPVMVNPKGEWGKFFNILYMCRKGLLGHIITHLPVAVHSPDRGSWRGLQ